MSRRPRQQWGHPTPERPYLDSGCSYQQPRGSTAMPYPPSSREPRQLPSLNLGYERPVLNTPLGPRLPSLSSLSDQSPDPRHMLASDSARGYASRQPMPQTLPLRTHYREPSISDPRGRSGPYDDISSPLLSHAGDHDSHQGRPFDLESQHSSSSTAMPSPVHSEKSTTAFSSSSTAQATRKSRNSSTIQQQDPARQKRHSTTYSMPLGFDKLLHHEPESSPPAPPRRTSTQPRYHLHVRQQPIAARACVAGDRDRRPVDPPPIVQILLTDFDPDSREDRDILQDPRMTVGCLLFPVSTSSPSTNPNRSETERDREHTHPEPEREGERERESNDIARSDDPFSTPLLSGKAFMSPFYVDADPDPNSAPIHPSSSDTLRTNNNNPSSNPISSSSIHDKSAMLNQPSTFFIFADLSIRSAGWYRLQFRLMNWGSVEDTGQSMPILAEAWSDPFRVYAAKDFPGMRDSSILAEGLKELGFVELKTKGKGKGKGRKRW